MTNGERDRWNRLSKNAKAMLRVLAKFASGDSNSVHLNDVRMSTDLRGTTSRDILVLWQELESRSYGTVGRGDEADPVFTVNVPAVQTLTQANRLTNQAPTEVDNEERHQG